MLLQLSTNTMGQDTAMQWELYHAVHCHWFSLHCTWPCWCRNREGGKQALKQCSSTQWLDKGFLLHLRIHSCASVAILGDYLSTACCLSRSCWVTKAEICSFRLLLSCINCSSLALTSFTRLLYSCTQNTANQHHCLVYHFSIAVLTQTSNPTENAAQDKHSQP